MKITMLIGGCLIGALAVADVAEPPRRDAAQQEIKEWFLENYY